MPNRILRDGILTSEAVSSLSWAEEVFYRRLMSVADDHGRFHASPKLIRAACYPLLIDKVSDADVGKWLTNCVTAALVSVYPAADGKRYLQIVKFGQQVRSASKYPEPCVDGLLAIDSSRKQVPAVAHLVEGGDVGVNHSEAKASGGRPPVDNSEAEPKDPRRELYQAGKSLLAEQGMPKAQTGSFITKLAQDYGQDVALEAVRSAVSNRPLEAAGYLKATCQRLKGERKDPVTVPSTDTGAATFMAAMDERKAEATRPPAEVLAMARRAVRTA